MSISVVEHDRKFHLQRVFPICGLVPFKARVNKNKCGQPRAWDSFVFSTGASGRRSGSWKLGIFLEDTDFQSSVKGSWKFSAAQLPQFYLGAIN